MKAERKKKMAKAKERRTGRKMGKGEMDLLRPNPQNQR